MRKQKRTLLTMVGTLIVVSMVLGTVPVFAANTGYLVTDFSAANVKESIVLGQAYTANGTVFVENDLAKVYLTAKCENGSVTAGTSEQLGIYGNSTVNASANKARVYILSKQYETRTDNLTMCKFDFNPTRIADDVYADFIFYGYDGSAEKKMYTLRVYKDKVQALSSSNTVETTFTYSDYFKDKTYHELAFVINKGNDKVHIYIDGILFRNGVDSYNKVNSFKYANIQCGKSFSGNLFLDNIYFVFGDTYANASVSAPTSVRVGDTLTVTTEQQSSSGAIGGKTFVWKADNEIIAVGGNSLNIKGRYVGKNITVEACGYDEAGMYGFQRTTSGTKVEYTGAISLNTGKDSNNQPTVTAEIDLSSFFAEEGNSGKSFVYLLAGYNGDMLVDCVPSKQITSSDASEKLTLTVTGVESKEKVKLFVWDSMGTIVPIENVFTW